jgi:hypothetical protein
MRAGENDLVRDAAWASLTGALAGGVVLTAFALSIGAGPLAIGFLSALPVVAQRAQLPGIALIERLRQRLAFWVVTGARVLILGMALLPFVESRAQAVLPRRDRRPARRPASADRQVVQLFAIEAARSVDNLSSIGGALGFLFAFRRFVVRPRDD